MMDDVLTWTLKFIEMLKTLNGGTFVEGKSEIKLLRL